MNFVLNVINVEADGFEPPNTYVNRIRSAVFDRLTILPCMPVGIKPTTE